MLTFALTAPSIAQKNGTPPQTNCGEALGGNEGIRLRWTSKTPAMTGVLVPLGVSLRRAFEVLPNEGVYVVIGEASYGIVWH
jgi:hypothetical protein